MKSNAMLDQLEEAAQKLGVRVSYEALVSSVGSGGLCRVKGQYRVIVDKRASTDERVATLATALSSLDWQGADLPDKARSLVQYFAVRKAS